MKLSFQLSTTLNLAEKTKEQTLYQTLKGKYFIIVII
jgi:hypothetical protein